MRKLIVLAFALLLTMAGVTQAAPEAQEILPRPQILTFTTSATMVDRTQLNNRTARIPVSWTTDSRPASANLVFEQVLPDGRVVNVELPRQNPYVASNGDGIAAPFPPGGNATSILLRVRLIDMVKITVYDEKTITLNIGDSPIPTPAIVTFTTSAANVGRNALNNRSARVPVSWVVDARPANSNLVFEQVLANGTSVNVELPRQNPIVSSSGIGVAAPVAPGGSATSIQLRLRVIDLASQRTLTQKDITLPIVENDIPTIITFSTPTTSVSRASLNNRSARIPVTWAAINRPANSNLVFEQVLDNGSVVNVELPRQNPYVASEGVGVAAPVNPGAGTTVKLQVRLIDLGTQVELAKRELTVSITESAAPKITLFTTTSASVDMGALTTRTARIPVSWNVDNRPDGSNLVFEQVLANGTSVNVELPRPNPYVASSGSGVTAPMPPGGTTMNVVQLRLRLVNLSNGATLDSKDITVPITGRPNETVWEKIADPTQCYSNGFPAGTGIVVSGRGRVVPTIPNGRLTVADQSGGGLIVGELLAGETFLVQSGPDCYKVSGGGFPKPLYLRFWHVSSEAKPVQGWISEYVMDSTTSAITPNIEPQGTAGNPPQIVTFTANPTSASPGQQVTLTWEVANATSIAFAQLPASVDKALANQLSGTTQFIVPSNASGTITVELTARNDAGQETRATVSISVVGQPSEATPEVEEQQAACPFNTSLADSCPVTQETVSASYQPFERGLMVWNGSTGMIYVLYSDGSWQEFVDTWAGEPDITVEGEQPPEGMSIPQRGFGKVWQQLGGQGAFGWATALESPYQATWETHPLSDADQTTRPHFILPDGRVVHLGINWSIS